MIEYKDNTQFEQNDPYQNTYPNLQKQYSDSTKVLFALQKNNLQNDEIIKLLKKVRNLHKKALENQSRIDKIESDIENIVNYFKYEFGFNIYEDLFYERKNRRRRKKHFDR